jgi:hypothetical protein
MVVVVVMFAFLPGLSAEGVGEDPGSVRVVACPRQIGAAP